MLIGKIVGTVVSNRKDPKVEGFKFMLVKNVDVDLEETGAYVVAADVVGAGIGEYVLYATGSSARQTVRTDRRPIDAVIMAIIDQWEIGGQLRYHKYREVD
ncbi:MAG: ethanolamine utilization protein EutN [Anaerolineae bacterium SM23_84]|nr:MAG: ethanolamine utilization protein EutN [Anaerolineae bacterium SM23_84]